MKEYLNAIGLFYTHNESNPYSYNVDDYKISTDEKKSEIHRNYLKNIENGENGRLTLIESKTSQLISQTGIIFSLLGLFIPILVDKITDIHFLVKFLLLALLILAFCFYMLTIQNALKNFNVKNFIYCKPSPKNVLDSQDKDISFFYAEEVKDLLYSINENIKTNNKKATNLLHSYTSFRIANISSGFLVISFSITLLFFNPKKEGIFVEKPIKIEKLDSLMDKLTKTISKRSDTVYIKIKDTLK